MSKGFLEELSETVLTHVFGPDTFYKGAQYQKKEAAAVLSVYAAERDMEVKGKVKGREATPYSTEFALKRDAKGQLMMSNSCTCHLRSQCKHVVALLLEAKKRGVGVKKLGFVHPLEEKQGSPSLPAWKTWTLEAESSVEKESSKELEKVVYSLKTEKNSLSCGLSKILKTGRFGKPKTLPAYLSDERYQPVDRELISQFIGAALIQDVELKQRGLFPLHEVQAFAGLTTLFNTERFFLNDESETPLWQGKEKKLSFTWTLVEGKAYKLEPCVKEVNSLYIIQLQDLWYVNLDTKECGKLVFDMTREMMTRFLNMPLVPLQEVAAFKKGCPEVLLPHVPLLKAPPKGKTTTYIPQPLLLLEGVKLPFMRLNLEDIPLVFPCFLYGDLRVPLYTPEMEIHRLIEGEYTTIKRNLSEEKKQMEVFLSSGKLKPISSFYFAYRLNGIQGKAFSFPENDEEAAVSFLKELVKKGWKVEVKPSFPCDWLEEVDEIYADIEMGEEGSSWFNLNLGILLNGEKINLVPILQKLLQLNFCSLSEINEISDEDVYPLFLENGQKVGLPGERLKSILKILFELYDPKKKALTLNKTRAAELFQEEGKKLIWKNSEELKMVAKQLALFHNPDQVPLPKSLQATLRPYQHCGLNWLQYLRASRFGGVLADDMGLGKTVQTLAHLLTEKEGGRMTKPSLIVAPTSLMSNWAQETARFAPLLKLLVLHGDQRKENFSSIKEYDVIVTTYPLLARDEIFLLSHSFYYLILDEAQFVKNAKTKAYQVLSALQADYRLCLTGTPMENNLGDLWSLFHFLNPGLLGSSKQFGQVFRTPIEKEGSLAQQALLAKRVAPFLLRRKKNEVALELPPKTEIIRKIALEGNQRDLYETLRSAMLEKIQMTVKEKGIAGSQIIILDALLKMRQVCCDPRLVKLEAAKSVTQSSKFQYLLSLLEELLSEGRKALLFSSFSSMLLLIEDELIKRGIAYAKLTGETKNRAEVVASFQEGKVPLFLISLKAGGTGLNLTQADTVIHYDPWWNPAAENQATDRAHRMGQDKPVFVYKLISEGTIEEKILALQQKKQELIQNLFATEGGKGFSLSTEEIETLFQPLA